MPHFPAYLVTFTEEILNGKLHFLCSVTGYAFIMPLQSFIFVIQLKTLYERFFSVTLSETD